MSQLRASVSATAECVWRFRAHSLEQTTAQGLGTRGPTRHSSLIKPSLNLPHVFTLLGLCICCVLFLECLLLLSSPGKPHSLAFVTSSVKPAPTPPDSRFCDVSLRRNPFGGLWSSTSGAAARGLSSGGGGQGVHQIVWISIQCRPIPV